MVCVCVHVQGVLVVCVTAKTETETEKRENKQREMIDMRVKQGTFFLRFVLSMCFLHVYMYVDVKL